MTRSAVRMRWGLQIPLRDGVLLSATLYLPSELAAPAPTLLAITPYTAQRNHARAKYFATNGFPFLVIDTRGRGNSQGTFRPFVNDADDGYDIIEWVAQQEFCNGKIGMFSGSYEGYVQWAAAKRSPPHLSVIAPSVAAAPGIDFPMRNNIPYPYQMRWLTSTAGRVHQERIFEDEAFWRGEFCDWFESGRPFGELDVRIGVPSESFHEWLNQPTQSEYWQRLRLSAAEYARLRLPILTLTGCYDADQLGALHFYQEHLRHGTPEAIAQHYLVIGPWDHQGALAPKAQMGGLTFGGPALLDTMSLHLQWYDWALRGGAKPSFLKKNVAYYVMGADEWRYADRLDDITMMTMPLYLDSNGRANDVLASGSLGDAQGRGPADSYIYDPSDVSSVSAEREREYAAALTLLRPTFPVDSLVDQTPIYENAGKALVYHSAPFSRALEVSGFFRFSAWIAIDQPDTDFLVTIHEVKRDGQSILLSADLMRARYRDSHERETLIKTSEPLLYEFERFTFTSRRIERGSRLRLVFGPLNSPHYQKNYNSGGVVGHESVADARVVAVKLYHDESRPSVLHVPIGGSRDEQPA